MLNPIETPNLSDAVYDILRRLIISGDFVPGQRLHLTELEASLNVSRTPLKTALKRLELEGLVNIHARRGTFIAETSVSKLEESYKIRSSFELYVALCLFKYLSPEDYAFFDAIRHQMNALVDSCEGHWQEIVTAYVGLDRQFHERLVAVGGPPRMLDMFKQLNVHLQMVSIIPNYGARDFQAMHFEHEQIFASIMDRSPERLNATLLNHLESARYRALHYAQENSLAQE